MMMRQWLTCLSLAGMLLVAGSLRAGPITFAIDPSQSALTLSGTAVFQRPFGPPATVPFLAQPPAGPASLFDSYSGTLTANQVGSSLVFSGGNSIVANLNPAGPFLPAPGFTGSGTVEDNYGILIFALTSVVQGAVRDLALDITAGSATNGLPPVGETIQISHGILDEVAGSGSTSQPAFADLTFLTPGANTAAGPVILDLSGGLATLTLPVDTTFRGTFRLPGGNPTVDVTFTLTGQLVAELVPEPGTLVLFGLGLAGLVAYARRRRATVGL